MIAAACPGKDPVKFALTLEKAARAVGVNFIGGYSALVQKGFGPGDYALLQSIPQALSAVSYTHLLQYHALQCERGAYRL